LLSLLACLTARVCTAGGEGEGEGERLEAFELCSKAAETAGDVNVECGLLLVIVVRGVEE
jgi:hypothetical protein